MHLLKKGPGTNLQSLVKIGSVTAEIFPTWTNVARANVVWTNVTVNQESVIYVPWNLILQAGAVLGSTSQLRPGLIVDG